MESVKRLTRNSDGLHARSQIDFDANISPERDLDTSNVELIRNTRRLNKKSN